MATSAGGFANGAEFARRYVILGELGKGSFGHVYRARQLSTGQEIALKVLLPPGASGMLDEEQRRERFRREMRLCASLSHPHIVRLIDSGEEGGLLYAAFEYLPGPTLREVLETDGRLEPGEALALMAQLLDALACAHEHGVVHRDLKPENIIVTKTGLRRNAMIVDFGLAGFVREAAELHRDRLTATNDMLGSPAYAAPEQLRGEAASPRSDLYAWGLIFLECLTGEVVMNGRTAYDAMMRQLGPDPVPLPVWLRDQPLGRLLASVTAKDPLRRDVQTAALLEALERIPPSVSHGAAPSPSDVPVAGEQRQMTVVACGTLFARDDGTPLDLEDLDELERAQLALYERIAREEGGTPVRPQASRLIVVFGYPRARENDARRAVRMARRIRNEAGPRAEHRKGNVHVGVRIGIHSGRGIARLEAPAVDGSSWCQVVGAPLRLACRLEERAQAGEILVTADTRLLLRENGRWNLAGEIDAAQAAAAGGGGAALEVFRGSDDALGRPPIEAARPEFALTGRAGELAQLVELWRGAEAGEPAIAFVQGEAGIGKSRLLRELRRRVPAEAWLECRCMPEDQASRLRPIVDLLNSLGTPIEELLVRYGFDVPASQPLFASLLGIEAGAYPPLRLSPERQKELTLNAVVSLLTRLTKDGPRVLAVEDLHWADPTTLELLSLLADECRAARTAAAATPCGLLVVFTARAEFSAAWATAEVTRISLARLGVRDVERMINTRRGTDVSLPAALVERIAEHADGIPLFVEELVHVVAAPDSTSRFEEQPSIPATLRELLAARLDGLSAGAYQTAQIAAALGREFSSELLEAVSAAEGRPAWMVHHDLSELLDARLLYRRSVANAYVFKHALVRDAAYDSMLGSLRRRVHKRIADAMVEHLPGFVVSRPEIMAHHLFHSGEPLRASEYWLRAGDYELRRAAYEEAIQHLEWGLHALESVAPGHERDVHELDLLITLGTVHLATKGAAVPEVADTFGKAQKVYDRVGDAAPPLKIFVGLYSTYVTRGDLAATEEILPRFEALAANIDDPVAALTGVTGLAVHAFWRGEHERAHAHLARGRALYRTGEFNRFVEDYGLDQGLYIYGYSVWNACIAGRRGETEAVYRELLDLADSSFNPYSVPLALAFGTAVAHVFGDVAATLERARRLIEIAAEQRMYLWLAIGQCGCGWALSAQGEAAEGIAQLRQGLDVSRMIGAMTPYAYYLTYLADALQRSGDIDAGLTTVDEGLSECATALARAHEPELLRIKGALLRDAGRHADAESEMRRALALARRRGAGGWAVRTADSLASLLREKGDAAEANAIVASVEGAFPDAAPATGALQASAAGAPAHG